MAIHKVIFKFIMTNFDRVSPSADFKSSIDGSSMLAKRFENPSTKFVHILDHEGVPRLEGIRSCVMVKRRRIVTLNIQNRWIDDPLLDSKKKYERKTGICFHLEKVIN